MANKKTSPAPSKPIRPIVQKDNLDVKNNKTMAIMNNMGKPVMASKQVSNAVKFLRSNNEGPGYEKYLAGLSNAETDSAGKLSAGNKIVTSRKMGGSIKKKK